MKLNCAICFQECKTRVTLLECNHLFHSSCIRFWKLQSVKGETCPTCGRKSREIESCDVDVKHQVSPLVAQVIVF